MFWFLCRIKLYSFTTWLNVMQRPNFYYLWLPLGVSHDHTSHPLLIKGSPFTVNPWSFSNFGRLSPIFLELFLLLELGVYYSLTWDALPFLQVHLRINFIIVMISFPFVFSTMFLLLLWHLSAHAMDIFESRRDIFHSSCALPREYFKYIFNSLNYECKSFGVADIIMNLYLYFIMWNNFNWSFLLFHINPQFWYSF